jgi:serine phosphatase RsbU (regulator of sigma subunit)
VLYTDGVTERRGAGDAEYGDARLLAAIQTGMQGSASQIVGAIVRDNDRFAQLAAADDDLTVLVAKRRRESGNRTSIRHNAPIEPGTILPPRL